MREAINTTLFITAILLASTLVASAQTGKTSAKGKEMRKAAKGTFEVNVTPAKDDEASAVEGIGRLAINKTWAGDLIGTSKGQMLGSSDASQTTGGYVAMEIFTGTLAGKKGSFALQHNGTMENGKFTINVEVIPGSGTGELKSIAGNLTIIIEKGKHSYELTYTLPK